jgi:cardiolipin synthase (CMP-forming)
MASNLNPANAVTASRFLTLPPLVWAIDQGEIQWATLLLMLCGVLDLFDGLVARAFNCQTPFGAVFDAIADAICYGTAMLVVTLYGLAPWPPVVIILVLGAVNMGLRAYYAHRAGRTINYQSHAMERLVAFAAYLAAFAIARFQVDYFYWTFAALFVLVLVHDAKRLAFDPIPALPPVAADAPAPRGGAVQAAVGGAS